MAARWLPDRGDIIWINHDPKAGGEMPGRHPMLVLSTAKFNDVTGIVIGVPMTHSAQHQDNPFAVSLQWPNREVSYFVCNQPKSFDWRERGASAHPRKKVPAAKIREVLDELDGILGVSR